MAKLISSSTTIRVINPTGSVSALEQMAVSLKPGQCRQLPTNLTGEILVYPGENSNFIQWGNSGVYDPTRKEISFIGTIVGENEYHWLVYSEITNSWSNSRPVWSRETDLGHGYDHTTIDPITGTLYHRVFGKKFVYKWNGTWSQTAAWTQSTEVVGSLTWFPGVGLMYSDGIRLLRYHNDVWTEVAYFGDGVIHTFSEYNPTANVMIMGGGDGSNSKTAPIRKIDADLNITVLADPPFPPGSGPRQGVGISDPVSANLIVYRKSTTEWARYDITANRWLALTQSTGDGAVPQNGTPNLVGDANLAVIGIPILAYGVIMFVQHLGNTKPAGVWLYRHS